jgi:hypothetical protein
MVKDKARYGILPRNAQCLAGGDHARRHDGPGAESAACSSCLRPRSCHVVGGKPLPNSAEGREPQEELAEAVTKLVSTHGFTLRPQCSAESSKRRNDLGGRSRAGGGSGRTIPLSSNASLTGCAVCRVIRRCRKTWRPTRAFASSASSAN